MKPICWQTFMMNSFTIQKIYSKMQSLCANTRHDAILMAKSRQFSKVDKMVLRYIEN